jgi:integrase/recombinase XerD
MTRRSYVDANLVDRFVRLHHFRHPQTAKNYACTLRGFQCFVAKHGTKAPLSISNVQRWLKERSLKWPAHILYHRAFLVERFLKWLQDQGVIPESPFVELHRHYGPRTTPIVRALVTKDPEASLQQLRRLPRFGSFLGKLMGEHVSHKRSLGYRYRTEEDTLLRFDRFLQRNAGLAGKPLSELIEHCSADQPSPYHLYLSQRAGRIVSKAMHRMDPKVPILSFGFGVPQRARQHHRRPHLYSDGEIRRILQAALSYPSPKAPLRPLTLFTMLMLAYCAGLRGREVIRLTLGDVDLQNGTIDIRDTKFFKHRRLPLAPGVMAVLKNYLDERKRIGGPSNPESSLFWTPQLNRCYTIGTMRIMLTDVLRRAGVKPPRGQLGPRVHDLRHTMVGHRMRDWYKEGLNPQAKLPYLATFLGHADIESTLVYLNITPELLQHASERFRNHSAAILRTSGESL